MQVKKAARTTVVSTRSQPSVRENFVAVFGAKAALDMEELRVSNTVFQVTGLVSSATKTSGKTSGHPQFFFINGRPFDFPKAVRIVNELYRWVPYTVPMRNAQQAQTSRMMPLVQTAQSHATFEKRIGCTACCPSSRQPVLCLCR